MKTMSLRLYSICVGVIVLLNSPLQSIASQIPRGKIIPPDAVHTVDYTEADSTGDYDVIKYAFHLEPYLLQDSLAGQVVILLNPAVADFDTLRLEAEGLGIRSVITAQSDTLEFAVFPGTLEVYLNRAYQPDDTVSLSIDYRSPRRGWTVYGFHRREDYCFTHAEPYGARHWFPCHDQPFDKAFSETWIQVPHGYKGIGNGSLSEIVSGPGGLTYHWIENHPVATYLVFLTAGPFIELTDTAPGQIPLRYYVYPEDSAAASFDFANTGDMLGFFADKFGAYPFDMYGMAEAHIFNGWGAMEHQSVSTMGFHLITGDRAFENVVSHELSHMWWGDCLTPLTFADIWLNEGFAIYSEALYIEARYDTLNNLMRNYAEMYFEEDRNVLRYPIYNPPPELLFGHAVYFKGGWVQHMLRNVIGDSAFTAGLRNYSARYAYGNVTTPEYITEMETASGENLGWFFEQWVYQAGYPEYDYTWSVTPAGGEYRVDLNLYQLQSNAPLFTMPLEFNFADSVNDTLLTVWNDTAVQSYSFTLTFQPSLFILDPEGKVLMRDLPAGILTGKPRIQPAPFSLRRNYPNPFNSATLIPFTLSTSGSVNLSIYNSIGQKAGELFTGHAVPGDYSLYWDAGALPGGVYWAVLSGGGAEKAIPILLLK